MPLSVSAGAVVSDVAVDFGGGPRPVGGYDIGADEIALRCFLPLLMYSSP